VNRVKSLLSALALALTLATISCAPPRPAAAAASPDEAEAKTEHFRFLYDPNRLTSVQVGNAETLAETAFKDVSSQFPNVRYSEPILIRLNAHFRGATGYAAPGGASGKGKVDFIGLRYEELPLLGLSPSFLFHHEITHLFAGRWENGEPNRRLAASALGEGLADLVANGRDEQGLPLSYARYLDEKGVWADPEDLFLDPPGGGPPQPQRGLLNYSDVLKWRIERYVEPSLFLAYVKQRIGWEKMRGFYVDYSEAAFVRNPSTDLRRVIRRYTDAVPEDFFDDWRRAMRAAPEEADANRLRWTSERVYSAVQWYEFLVLGKVIDEADQPGIEADLKSLHQEVAARRLDAAEAHLRSTLQRIASASHGHAKVSDAG
jgi:hypothetical protein